MPEYRQPTITRITNPSVNNPFTHLEQNESLRKEKLIQACRELELQAEDILLEEYPKSEYPFHNIEHSKEVADNVEDIIRLIQSIDPELVSDEDIAFARAEAMFHDIPQDRKEFNGLDYNPETGQIVRKRGFDERNISEIRQTNPELLGNEQRAALNFIQNILSGPNAELFKDFTDEEIFLDFGSTYPNNFFDTMPDEYLPDHLKGKKIFTMTQPFAQKAGIRGLALALADLKETGGHSRDDAIPHRAAIESGNNEFRELNREITLKVAQLETGQITLESFDQPERIDIVNKIIAWKKSQEGFYLGQRFDLEQILAKNPALSKNQNSETAIKQALRDRYSDFDVITQGLRQEYIALVDTINSKIPEVNDDTFISTLNSIGYQIEFQYT